MEEQMQGQVQEQSFWNRYPIEHTEIKAIIRENINAVCRNYIAIGYYLKQVQERNLYLEDGYQSLGEYAQAEYGIEKTAASRLIQVVGRFCVEGNTPVLLPEYRDFSVSKLKEMLYLTEEQIEQVTADTTVKEIRELKKPEWGKPSDSEREYLGVFARKIIRGNKEWMQTDLMNRVWNVEKSPVELKGHLDRDAGEWELSMEVETGTVSLRLLEEGIQLYREGVLIGSYKWFYLAAAIQNGWTQVAIEDIEGMTAPVATSQLEVASNLEGPEESEEPEAEPEEEFDITFGSEPEEYAPLRMDIPMDKPEPSREPEAVEGEYREVEPEEMTQSATERPHPVVQKRLYSKKDVEQAIEFCEKNFNLIKDELDSGFGYVSKEFMKYDAYCLLLKELESEEGEKEVNEEDDDRE